MLGYSTTIAFTALQASAIAASVTINADTPIILPANASTGLSLTFRDFQFDWYEAFGHPPTVYHDMPKSDQEDPSTTPVIVFGTAELLPDVFAKLKLNQSCVGPGAEEESHCIQTFSTTATGYSVVAAVGSDSRGAQFAAYSFSEILLGVSPWKWFADQRPVQRDSIVLPADGAPGGEFFFPPFLFKHRAGFPNDEDLFGNSQPSPMGDTVWSDTAYDRYYETMLRMKMNGVLVGTNPAPDERSVALASRRGLFVQHHHYNLLGSYVFRWPLGKDGWDWRTDTQAMSYMYRASVAAQSDLDVIWSVGLRGLNDYPYPCDGDVDCATQINECMSNQTAWIQEAQPGAKQVTYLWSEGIRYLSKGLLQIPNGTEVVFGDQGAGFIHGDGNLTEFASGLYYHTAMYDGHANQLTEMIPVSRIISQIYQIFVALAKKYFVFVLNTSDMRPASMTTDAAMRLIRNPDEFFQSLSALAQQKLREFSEGRRTDRGTGIPLDIVAARDFLEVMARGKSEVAGGIERAWMDIDPNSTALLVYEQWARKQYGLGADPASAATVAQAWQDYFDVPYIQSGSSDNALAGDLQKYATTAAKEISQDGAVSKTSMSNARDAMAFCDNATMATLNGLVATAKDILGKVPEDRRPFVNYHFLVGFLHQQLGCSALLDVAKSTEAANQSDFTQAGALAQSAMASLDTLLAARQQSEYGIWRHMFFGDHLSGFDQARRSVRQIVVAAAAAGKKATLPGITLPHWYAFENYQVPFEGNFPLQQPSLEWRMSDYVRVHCNDPDYDTGACVNTPDGGHFRVLSGADTSIVMYYGPPGGETVPGVSIRYTTDGSEPTPGSKSYVGPLDLSSIVPSGEAGVMFRVKAEVNGSMVQVEANSSWTRW